jgi:hypothetical protein
MFIKDLTNYEWEVLRYMRHKAWLIERKARQRPEYQKRRKTIEAERKITVAEQARALSNSATDEERLAELDCIVDDSIWDVDQIFRQTDEELAHAHGLEDGIDYYERLDDLLNVAITRRNDCLEQISQYRYDLGQHLRRVSDVVIDAEFEKVDARAIPGEVPLVPLKEETQ